MNAEQLKKDVGRLMRLRPHPVVVKRSLPRVNIMTSEGAMFEKSLVKTDYDWRIEDVSDKKEVTLHCLHTGHTITLGADNVKEYRSPHFLLLKCQLILDGDKIHIEPCSLPSSLRLARVHKLHHRAAARSDSYSPTRLHASATLFQYMPESHGAVGRVLVNGVFSGSSVAPTGDGGVVEVSGRQPRSMAQASVSSRSRLCCASCANAEVAPAMP